MLTRLRELGNRASAALTGRILRTRSLVRAPIWLYRHRLGVVFGQRLLMLQHTGRRSGLARYVVLEVVDRPGPDRYLVVSGFGRRSQWLQNVLADAQVRVSVGRRTSAPATARLLDEAETAAALATYASAHPRAWSQLRRTMEQALGVEVEHVPMVALDLAG